MKSLYLSAMISFGAGGLYALTYPSFLGNGWPLLLFVALPLFLYQLEKVTSFKQHFLVVLGYNLGLNVVGYYWIPQTLVEFGQLPYLVALILGLFFSFILQPHWWVYLLWKKWRPDQKALKWNSPFDIFISALIITLLERYVPQQFPSYAGSPWLHLAPYLGLTPYLGVVAFSFMTYWVALETVFQWQKRQWRPYVWCAFSVFILLNAIFPLRWPDDSSTSIGSELKVRMVQANIGNFLKVESERGNINSFDAIKTKYRELSLKKGDFTPDLIIWPETAYPDTFIGKFTHLQEFFLDIMNMTGAELLIGGYDQNLQKSALSQFESVYNSSILISEGQVKSSYHKNILIPFGETLPFGPFNQQIVSIVPTISLFAKGTGTPLMETRGGLRFVTPICYEILESNYMRDLLNQWKHNSFIVNHTNDSWYGDTAEPHQHLFLSKWRALEFQLPILRSTNTGITSVIYPDGSESTRLGVGDYGALDIKLKLPAPQNTVYQRFGIFPSLGMCLVLLLGMVVTRKFLKWN